MKMQVSILALLFFSATNRASAQAGCSLIDPTRPAQSVSYEMLETADTTPRSLVPAGKSLTFTVPLFHFDHWLTIEVPFRYAWDTDTDRPAHHAIFGNLDLPMEIMQKTKSCGLIDWCKSSR